MPFSSIHFAGPDAQVLVLVCQSQIVGSAADELYSAATRHIPDRDDLGIVLDFTDTLQISSVAIAGMLQLQKLCKGRDAPLVLTGLSPDLLQFLTMLQLAKHFTIEPTLGEAVARAARRTPPA
jgi:anti-anti-sigma regulatory factor